MENRMLDLNDWGNVLDRLSAIKKNGHLEHWQGELVRMLKHRGNWRLREAALVAARQIEKPAAPLVAEILNTILDDNLYCEARVLACTTLMKLMEGRANDKIGDLSPSTVAGHLRAIAAVPQPPLLAKAVTGCLECLDGFGQQKAV